MSSSDVRVGIIGAGAAGLSCAVQLAALGCTDVVVLDQSHVAAGSSSLSVGMFTRSYFEPLDIDLRIWSHDFIGYLERTEGLALRRNGFLRYAHDGTELDLLHRGVQRQRQHGITDSVMLTPAEIQQRFPDLLAEDLTGAMYLPKDGYLDGAVLCSIYQEVATRHGVRVLGKAQIQGVETIGSTFRLVTTRGDFDVDVVVNAAGAWSNRIADLLDSPVHLTPQRHEAAVLRLIRPLPYLMPNVMDYVPGSALDGVYFRHEGEHQLVAGVHSNEVHSNLTEDPDSFPCRAGDAFVEQLAGLLETRLVNADDLTVEDTWAGLYPMSSDGMPILGATAQAGVYACTGLGGVGIYLSPIAGRLVAESIVYGEFRAVTDAEPVMARRLAESTN
jgi:sarcosine oxidase subunit beta